MVSRGLRRESEKRCSRLGGLDPSRQRILNIQGLETLGDSTQASTQGRVVPSPPIEMRTWKCSFSYKPVAYCLSSSFICLLLDIIASRWLSHSFIFLLILLFTFLLDSKILSFTPCKRDFNPKYQSFPLYHQHSFFLPVS